jgi:WD40 repeat protein
MSPVLKPHFLITCLVFAISQPVKGDEGAKPGRNARKDRYGDLLPKGAMSRMGTVRFRQVVGRTIYSPDGTRMAAPSGDVVRLWDATTGKDIRTFAGHGGPVHSVAFDPTGKMLASGGGDTIRLWNVETGREEGRMNTHFPYELVFSPNGKFLFSSSTEDVRVWNVAERKEIRTLGALKGAAVFSLVVSPDNKYLAAQADDGPTHIWEIETGKALHLSRVKGARLAMPFFLRDSKTLAEVHEDQVIYYEIPTGRELRRLQCGGYPGALSPDEKTLVLRWPRWPSPRSLS